MQTDDRLHEVLDRWVAAADSGRLLSAAELCRDCPELRAEAERQIAVLQQFHLLARPTASTFDDGTVAPESLSGEPTLDVPLRPLPVAETNFSRYRIIAELGKGGMGIVYKARDTQLDREVALKVMRPDLAANPATSDRFLREAKALAAVRHDHVVEVYDYGEMDGRPFITMPLLAGQSLETRLDRQRGLPPTEVIRIGAELAEGLAAVHDKGLIHRDLKPSNVWLESPGDRVKLLDFGLARDSGASKFSTSPGSVVGTPAYMSPEQVNGLSLDSRADLFSLGGVLYKAATGEPPFSAPTLIALLAAVGKNDPLPARTVNPAVPAELSDLIGRLQRKNPEERPASAAEVAKELRGLPGRSEAPTAESQRVPKQQSGNEGKRRGVPRWSSPVRYTVALTLGLFLVLGLTLSHFLANRSRNERPADDPPSTPIAPAEPLRVRALDILHLPTVDSKRTMQRRVLGTESFGAVLGDDIKVTARLSRPAYSYLIVFRPDGKDEVLYPQRPDDVPERIDEPRYPSKVPGKVYGLTDGTGLWLVALVASDKPLPAYAEWRNKHPGGRWANSDGEANVVWRHDGQWLDAVTPGGARNRGERDENEAAGTAAINRVVDWLKAETGGTVSAVGFTVEAKK
jgi:serine/threonine protein kinase